MNVVQLQSKSDTAMLAISTNGGVWNICFLMTTIIIARLIVNVGIVNKLIDTAMINKDTLYALSLM